MSTTSRQVELLAPAGNLEVALTAYSAGADAVYAGFSRFNAREMAENFSYDDMSRLAEYSKKRDKKYYLTLNTLVSENELDAAAEDLYRISLLEPDGIIVQDIGILRMIRDYFPRLEIHASTQMGIHNSLGVAAAEQMGVRRVILERQVTLQELTEIIKKTDTEIEVFIHGALCCSLSGNCLYSSWIGGWSGNRGKCKQPCRRRFHTVERRDKKSGFFFSTNDLYSLDMVHDLVRCGVASLKIEGRLKSAAYVEKVVTAYRMVLDTPAEEQKGVIGEARGVLAKSLARKWTHGFWFPEDKGDIIQHESLGVSGQIIGGVAGINDEGFYVTLSRRIHLGDRLRVQPKSGDGGPAFTVTNMKVGNAKVKSAREGEKAFIYTSREIPLSGLVFKVEETGKKPHMKGAPLPLFAPRIYLDINLTVSKDLFTGEIKNVAGTPQFKKQLSLEEADNRPLSKDDMEKMFRATRSEEFRAGTISSVIDGNLFFPAAELKTLRREFWEWACREAAQSSMNRPENRWETKRGRGSGTGSVSRSPGTDSCLITGKQKRKKQILVRDIFDFGEDTNEVVLPHFCPESRLKELKAAVDRAISKGIRRFRCTSLFHLSLLKVYPDIQLCTSFPLPVTNTLACEELADYQVSKVQGWLELGKEALNHLIETSPLPVELYTYGRPFLLATRARVEVEGAIVDARNKMFTVERGKRYGLTYVYPREVLSIPASSEHHRFYDYTHAADGERSTSTFNFEHHLL